MRVGNNSSNIRDDLHYSMIKLEGLLRKIMISHCGPQFRTRNVLSNTYVASCHVECLLHKTRLVLVIRVRTHNNCGSSHLMGCPGGRAFSVLRMLTRVPKHFVPLEYSDGSWVNSCTIRNSQDELIGCPNLNCFGSLLNNASMGPTVVMST